MNQHPEDSATSASLQIHTRVFDRDFLGSDSDEPHQAGDQPF